MKKFSLFLALLLGTQLLQAQEADIYWSFDKVKDFDVPSDGTQACGATISEAGVTLPNQPGFSGKAIYSGHRGTFRSNIEIPHGDTFTLSFWIKQINTGSTAWFGAPFNFTLDRIKVKVDGLGDLVAKRVSPGSWEHVALVVQPGKATLVVNGVEEASLAKEGWTYPSDKTRLHLGSANWHAIFLGMVDELRLHKRALSTKDVAAQAAGAYSPDAAWISARPKPVQATIHRLKLDRTSADGFEAYSKKTTPELLGLVQQEQDHIAAFALAGREGKPFVVENLLRYGSAQNGRNANLDAMVVAWTLKGCVVNKDKDVQALPADSLRHENPILATAALQLADNEALLSVIKDNYPANSLVAAMLLKQSGWQGQGIEQLRVERLAGNTAAEKTAPAAELAQLRAESLRNRVAYASQRQPHAFERDPDYMALVKAEDDGSAAMIALVDDRSGPVRLMVARYFQQVKSPSHASTLAKLMDSQLDTDKGDMLKNATVLFAEGRKGVTSEDLVLATLKALAVQGNPDAVPAVKARLMENNIEIREEAAAALAAMLDETALVELADSLLAGGTPQGTAAACALIQHGNLSKFAPALAVIVQKDAAWRNQTLAAKALASIAAPGQESLLKPLLKHGQWTVRYYAYKGLIRVDEPGAEQWRAKAAKDDSLVIQHLARG